jgi:hypothetical protein
MLGGLVTEKGLLSVRDFCGIGLWSVMDSAGFSATGFTDNILFSLILRLVQASVNH